MTEETGFDPAPEDETAEPAEEATPLPDENADPQEVAEEAADAEPADPPAPPVQEPGWLLDVRNQFPGTLTAFAEDVYRRLRNLGG